MAAKPIPLPDNRTSEVPPPPTGFPAVSVRENDSDHVIPPSSDVLKFVPAACRTRPFSSSVKVDEWKYLVS
jgi:hypothetical protein